VTNNQRHIETADPPGLALFAIGGAINCHHFAARFAHLQPATVKQYQSSGGHGLHLTSARTLILYRSSVVKKGIADDRDAFPTNRKPCGHDQVLQPRNWQKGGRETTIIRGRVVPRTATL
jgi:hypothetical protein